MVWKMVTCFFCCHGPQLVTMNLSPMTGKSVESHENFSIDQQNQLLLNKMICSLLIFHTCISHNAMVVLMGWNFQ